jgi:putative ABC transport system permease protein
MRQYYLTEKDYLDIRAEAPTVKNIAPIITRNDIPAVSEFFTSNGQVLGVAGDFKQIRYLPMTAGRWLNDMDEAQGRNVVVLGDEARRLLFPGRPAVDNTILLNGLRFQVVGTLGRVGRSDDTFNNLKIYMPYSTMRERFPPRNTGDTVLPISNLLYQPVQRELHQTAKLEVHKIIARNHGFDYRSPDAFDEWDTIASAEMVGKIFDAMNMFLGSVGLVTLALGAIGVINIMLVAVADRTREIGLRKALGATNRSIMFQFFVEGIFLTVISGGLGMGAAAAMMAALSKLPSPRGFDPPKLVFSTAALAIGALAIAGLVAGLYPARRAALLQPVEALRKE